MPDEKVAQPSVHAQTLLRDAVNGHADSAYALSSYIVRLEKQRPASDTHCLVIEEGATVAICGHCGSKYHLSLFRDALVRVAEEAFRLGKVTHSELIDRAVQAGYRS